jgi:hypothetical protein
VTGDAIDQWIVDSVNSQFIIGGQELERSRFAKNQIRVGGISANRGRHRHHDEENHHLPDTRHISRASQSKEARERQ